MMSNKLTFIGCDATLEDASLVIIGAPFDGTTSFRPGTRFAPQTVRLESVGLETYSPYECSDLTDFLVHDAGDVDVVYGNTSATLQNIKHEINHIYTLKKTPCIIGGEHLVSLPAIEAAHKHYPDLCVIQFDAHTDLREHYEGEPLSHATVMRHVMTLLGPKRLAQFGIRSGTKEEFDFAKKQTHIETFTLHRVEEIIELWIDKPIYLTLDLDVLDPSIMSGTGTPEAGGVMFDTLHQALRKLKRLNIVGFDVVELSPHYDSSGVSTAVAAKLIRELILITQSKVA